MHGVGEKFDEVWALRVEEYLDLLQVELREAVSVEFENFWVALEKVLVVGGSDPGLEKNVFLDKEFDESGFELRPESLLAVGDDFFNYFEVVEYFGEVEDLVELVGVTDLIEGEAHLEKLFPELCVGVADSVERKGDLVEVRQGEVFLLKDDLGEGVPELGRAHFFSGEAPENLDEVSFLDVFVVEGAEAFFCLAPEFIRSCLIVDRGENFFLRRILNLFGGGGSFWNLPLFILEKEWMIIIWLTNLKLMKFLRMNFWR